MTNDRPYRRALERDEARRRIASGAGTAFDPRVVRALLDAL
jgi:HD-GYP domain-containing protein (c-di-GMP phosphodiesterase class II)